MMTHKSTTDDSGVLLGLFSVILTIWSFCQYTQTHTLPHTRVPLCVILPIWNVCLLLRCGCAEHTLRGAELLIKSSNFILQRGLKVQSTVFVLILTVSNPDSRVCVTRRKKTLLSDLWGVSDRSSLLEWQQSNPWWRRGQTHSQRCHEGEREARGSVWWLTTHTAFTAAFLMCGSVKRILMSLFWLATLSCIVRLLTWINKSYDLVNKTVSIRD